MDWSSLFRKSLRDLGTVLSARPNGSRRGVRTGAVITLEEIAKPECAPRRLAEGSGPIRGSAGVDGVTIQEFEKDCARIWRNWRGSLRRERYRPQPVRRVYVPKRQRRRARPLAITCRQRSHRPARTLRTFFSPHYEKKFLDCSYGCREGRFSAGCRRKHSRRAANKGALGVDGDIKNFYENIDHCPLAPGIAIRDRRQAHPETVDEWLNARIFNELDGRDLTVGTFQWLVVLSTDSLQTF